MRKMVEKLLEGSEVRLNTEYKTFIAENPEIAERTIYTGAIDAFENYERHSDFG